MPFETMVECRIHPAIGVARLGNSPDEWFVGPENPGVVDVPEGGFKDAQGRVKRQAARFRIFGYDAAGEVLGELTSEQAEIDWSAHIANKKAAWYEWDLALDIPEASMKGGASRGPILSVKRNRAMNEGHPEQLIIDPGPRRISGPAQPAQAFDSGRFFDTPVPLGELRTDEAGRLLVLGGFGTSDTVIDNLGLNDRANNDYWYDDTADGPVSATVTVDGRRFQAQGAWVICAPPSFAPHVRSCVTAYDVVRDAAARLDPAVVPARPSFRRHIYPLFETFEQNQWVNAGFLRDFGWQAENNPFAPDRIAALADPSNASLDARRELFMRFRRADYTTFNFEELPPYYGDGVDFPAKDPRQWIAVTPLQYQWLSQWADGDFDADWPLDGNPYAASFDDLALSEQPAALDEAALENCVGGGFNPGHEVPWILRNTLLYSEPYRIRRRAAAPRSPVRSRRGGPIGGLEPDYGSYLDTARALASNGPLSASGPGDLTRWMALPWQADAASCGSAFTPNVDPYLPTFWPAGVPNEAISEPSYLTIVDQASTPEQRQAAFRSREKFHRSLIGGFFERAEIFTREWGEFPMITRRPGPGSDDLPATLQVETGSKR